MLCTFRHRIEGFNDAINVGDLLKYHAQINQDPRSTGEWIVIKIIEYRPVPFSKSPCFDVDLIAQKLNTADSNYLVPFNTRAIQKVEMAAPNDKRKLKSVGDLVYLTEYAIDGPNDMSSEKISIYHTCFQIESFDSVHWDFTTLILETTLHSIAQWCEADIQKAALTARLIEHNFTVIG